MTASPAVRAWTHQEAARLFVLDLWKRGGRGAMLAMIMGSGKTRVAINLVNALGVAVVLILCPRRVVEVWRVQFQQYSEHPYEFVALDDRIATNKEKTLLARQMIAWAKERGQKLAICINYESARIEPFASWALKTVWPLVITDECHRLKGATGRTSKFVSHLALRSVYRLGLTGTPMPHQPLDIWGQFRFLDRNILDPTYGSFKLRHAVMGGWYGKQIVEWKDLDQLYAKFRRIAFEVGEEALDLPPEIDQTLSADFTPEGARIYGEMENEMVAWIKDMEGRGVEVVAANALVKLRRLQQITGGSLPDDLGEPVQIDNAKEALLTEFLEDVGEEPVVVFAIHKADLAAIHRAAAANSLASSEISGTRDELREWNGGSASVLAVQIQSGGEGIDLTRSRIAVYYSHGFSLAQYLQSRFRVRRPPQKRPCAFYHLHIRDSIDQYVLDAVLDRRDLIDSVLTGLKKKEKKS